MRKSLLLNCLLDGEVYALPSPVKSTEVIFLISIIVDYELVRVKDKFFSESLDTA